MAPTIWRTSSSATTCAWDSWSQPYTSGTGGGTVWGGWNNQWAITTSTTVTYRIQTWQSWIDNTVRVYSMEDLATPVRFTEGYARVEPRQRTEDEWNDVRLQREAQRIDRDADAVHAAARAEAHKLLAFVLTPAQMASYEARRFFDVVGSAGGVYRIHHGTSGNIRRVIEGAEVNRLCVHPQLHDGGGYLPTEDCLAAQALALMHDEIGAVSKANVHQGQRLLQAA